jgi:transcriptional regulator with XRE-family HTH domain
MGLLASSLVNKLQTWPEYLRRITGGLPPADIARRSGIPLSTITRWLAGETKPSPAKINVLAAHFPLDRDEAHRVVAAYSASPRPQERAQIFQIGGGEVTRKTLLRMYSDLELATEIVRRIEEHDSVEFAVPFDPEVHGEDTNITPLRPNVPTPVQDDRAVAKKKSRDPGGDEGEF